MQKSFIFVLIPFLFTIALSGQELLPVSSLERVGDPFESNHLSHRFIAFDSLANGRLQLDYERLFGLAEINNLGLQTIFHFSPNWGSNIRIRYLNWGPYTNIISKTGFIVNLPLLFSTLMADIKYRNYQIEPVFRNSSFQVDMSGSIYLRKDFYFFWSINDIFEWNTAGPVHGQSVLGLNYKFSDQMEITMGIEQNYLYQMDTWVAIEGQLQNILSLGISYISLEQEVSLYTAIRYGIINLETGFSYHPILGSSFRSGVGVAF